MQYASHLLFCLLAFTTHVFSATTSPSVLCLDIQPGADTLYTCPGASIVLTVSGGTDYNWSPAEDFDNPQGDTVTLTPSASQWYYVSGMGPDSLCSDSVFVVLAEFSVTQPPVFPAICPLDEVTIEFMSNAPIDSVQWSNLSGVNDPTSTTGTTLNPLNSGEYIVTAFYGGCTLMDTFNVVTTDFRFSLVTSDTLYLCLNDSVRIIHNLFPISADVVWSPLDSTIRVEPPANATVKPTVSTTYTATATDGVCSLMTTTFVRVDSLPDTLLTVIPIQDPYCAGEMITVFAEKADTMKYPDIEFQWFPDDGQIQDSTNTGNVFVILQDTTTFLRVMRNNACVDTSVLTVNVIPPDLPLSVTDTTLCPGETFVVEVLDPDVTDIEWSPTTGLSCSDCKNPTVTVSGPVQYTVTAEKARCSVMGMLSVDVYPMLNIPVSPASIEACPGDMIQFNIDLTGLTNVNISVSGGSVSCSDCANPVVTYTGGTVTLTVTADEMLEEFCGARGTATILMNDNQNYNSYVSLPTTPLCPGDMVQISIDTTGLTNLQLAVSGNASLSCTTCINPVLTYTGGGSITFTANADENFPDFCSAMFTQTINQGSDTTGLSISDQLCPGIPKIVDLSALPNITGITVTSGDATVSCTNCPNPEVTIGGASTLQVTSDSPFAGYCSQITEVQLSPAADQNVVLITSPTADSIHQGEIVTIGLNPPDGSNYQWKVNGTAVDGNTASVEAPFNEKENVVMVQWTNAFGCTQTLMQIINALDPEYKIPNAFTPGGGMTNTHFRVQIDGNYELMELLVFNRWGQLVYEGNSSEGWDGRHDGEPAPPEVYVYIAKLRAPSGKVITDKGDVTLIR